MIPSLTAGLPLMLVAEHAEVVRDRISNLEKVLASYKEQLAGTKPTRLLPATLQDDIARVEARIANYRRQLGLP